MNILIVIYWYQSLKKRGSMTHKRGPVTLDNCNPWLWTPTVWRKWPKKKFTNSNITNWVSVFVSLFLSLPVHSLNLTTTTSILFFSLFLFFSLDFLALHGPKWQAAAAAVVGQVRAAAMQWRMVCFMHLFFFYVWVF